MNQQVNSAIVPFTFRGDELQVIRLADGDVGVPLRRLCEAVGVDPDGQLSRLSRTPGQWATTSIMEVVAGDGKVRSVAILARRSIPMWAATLDVSRLASTEAREKVIAYQDECAEVLAEHFLGARTPAHDDARAVSELRGELAELRVEVASLRGRRGRRHLCVARPNGSAGSDARPVIRVVPGDLVYAVNKVTELLRGREDNEMFRSIRGLVRVLPGGRSPVRSSEMMIRLSQIARFRRLNHRTCEWLVIDPPGDIIRAVIADAESWAPSLPAAF